MDTGEVGSHGRSADGTAAGDRILVPVLDERAVEGAMPTLLALAARADAELVFVDLETTDEQTPFTVDDRVVATTSRPGTRLVQQWRDVAPSGTAWTTVQEGRTAGDAVASAVRAFDASTAVVAVGPDDWSTAERAVVRADCEVVTATVGRGDAPASVLAVHTDEETAETVDRVASAMAAYHGADLDHVEAEAAAERLDDYDLTVLGASCRGRIWERLFGSTEKRLREATEGDVLTVRPRSRRASRLGHWVGV